MGSYQEFLRALLLSQDMTTALHLTIKDLANLLTRSWNDREQRFVEEMSVDEVCFTTELHSHHSILYMMSVADKVYVCVLIFESLFFLIKSTFRVEVDKVMALMNEAAAHF